MRTSLQNTVTDLLKDKLSEGKTLCFSVTSGSMEPQIRAGDRVIVSGCRVAELKAGDIILFQKGSIFCTHRFVRKLDSDLVIAKGDRQTGFDTPFHQSQIIGKVMAIERNQRRIDLRRPKLQQRNNFIGQLANIQWTIYSSAKHIQRALFKNRHSTFLIRMILSPISMIIRLVNHKIFINDNGNRIK